MAVSAHNQGRRGAGIIAALRAGAAAAADDVIGLVSGSDANVNTGHVAPARATVTVKEEESS